jgi:hypothetical protein
VTSLVRDEWGLEIGDDLMEVVGRQLSDVSITTSETTRVAVDRRSEWNMVFRSTNLFFIFLFSLFFCIICTEKLI